MGGTKTGISFHCRLWIGDFVAWGAMCVSLELPYLLPTSPSSHACGIQFTILLVEYNLEPRWQHCRRSICSHFGWEANITDGETSRLVYWNQTFRLLLVIFAETSVSCVNSFSIITQQSSSHIPSTNTNANTSTRCS